MVFLFAGALVYFVYSLNAVGLLASLAITIVLFLGLKAHLKTETEKYPRPERPYWIWSVSTIAFAAISLIIASNSATSQAIISPWTVANPWLLASLGASALSLVFALSSKASFPYKAAAMIPFLISSFSLAAIIFSIGYGYDPFIHQAAMEEIVRYGVIQPKTPYYLGQYALITALVRLGLPLGTLNRWLLPILSAFSLPFLFSYLNRSRGHSSAGWLGALLLFFLSFSPFIMTTPQNFSYLLLIAVSIFLYAGAPAVLPLVTAAAAFAIHPLAGVPAVILCLAILGKKKKLPKILFKPAILFIASFLAFSFLIWLISGFGTLHFQSFDLNLLMPSLPNQETYLLDLAYLFITNHFWIILLAALGIFFCRHNLWPEKESRLKERAATLAVISLAALCAYLISRGFRIEGLIAYEQGDYAARLPIIALAISLPLFWELLREASKRVGRQSKPVRLIAAIGISSLLVLAVYASYPRFDNYHNSRGYSTSASDIEAVLDIERNAAGKPYIVLANQQVSAAALKELGFHNRYLKEGQMYFYPIPTGGELYQYYLKMVYEKAEKETMVQAMDAAGVDQAFLVVNRYWWASDKIIAEAKLSADSWQRIGQGDLHFFKYER